MHLLVLKTHVPYTPALCPADHSIFLVVAFAPTLPSSQGTSGSLGLADTWLELCRPASAENAVSPTCQQHGPPRPRPTLSRPLLTVPLICGVGGATEGWDDIEVTGIRQIHFLAEYWAIQLFVSY